MSNHHHDKCTQGCPCCCKHHSHHEHGSCGATCSHHHHDDDGHGHCHFPDQLLKMADDAWMEVLKDEIKKEIQSKNGQQLTALARLVSDSNHSRWKTLLTEKHQSRSFRQKIVDFFSKGQE